MSRLAFALLAALLAGCSTPSVDRGFVVRTDLRTTDCAGNASPSDINAAPSNSNPFNFLNLEEDAWVPEGQPDNRPKVRDCTKETGEVSRTAGLKLQRGDTLYLGTGAVGPAFQQNGLPNPLHAPAALSGPVKVTLRSVEPKAGRLYAEEDMLLAAALSMARSSGLATSTALADTLDRRQLLLWNTLLDHLRLWRSSVGLPGEGAPGERPALALLVDHASWCLDIQTRLKAEPGDRWICVAHASVLATRLRRQAPGRCSIGNRPTSARTRPARRSRWTLSACATGVGCISSGRPMRKRPSASGWYSPRPCRPANSLPRATGRSVGNGFSTAPTWTSSTPATSVRSVGAASRRTRRCA